MTDVTTSVNDGQGGDAVEGAAAAATEQGQGTAAEVASASTAQAAVRPEGLDDKFWDDASGLKVGDLVSHLRDLEAKAAERMTNVPGEGEAYDLALPEGFEKPEGIEIEFKTDDPLWTDFQDIARAEGVSKDGFAKFVGAFAKYQIAAQEADINTFVAEKTALGANADARIKAAETYLKANLPTVQAEALGGALISKAGVEALETLIKLKSGPTAATNAGASSVSQFEGLRGGDLLDAVRTNKAA